MRRECTEVWTSAESPVVALAGVDFSQVDLAPVYWRVGLALAIGQLVAWGSIPRRQISRRTYRSWQRGLLALLAVGWASVLIGFRWPEVARGHDFFNVFTLIGCLVVAPLATLVGSVAIWLVRRRRPVGGDT